LAERKTKIISKSLGNIKWTSLGAVLPKLFQPFVIIWLATILDPSAYGIVAIASIIIGFTNLIQGLGLSEFIIKEENLDDNKLSVAFWSNLVFGIVIYGIILLLTPIFSDLYSNDELSKVLPVLSLLIIINSFGVVQYGLLQKQMFFKKIFFIQLVPLTVLAGITLPLAYFGFGVWALVLGQLAKAIISNLLYWIFSSWRPSIYYSFSTFKNMFSFGKWVVVEKIVEYSYSTYDIFLIGIYYDIKIVGLYSVAKHITRLIYSTFNGPIGAIMFPMFSLLQHSKNEFKDSFLKVTRKMSFFNIPIMFGITILSHIVIPIVFPDKWEGLSLILSIIVLGEGMHRNFWVQRDIFKVLNKPDIYPKAILLNLAFGLVFYSLVGSYSIIIFCILRVVNDYFYTILQIRLISRVLSIKISKIIRCLLNPIYSGLIMISSLLFSILILDKSNIEINVFILTLLVISGGIIYFISSLLIDKKDLLLIINNVKTIFNIR
jgi:O-antigen/teichoic acid export membrane protein